MKRVSLVVAALAVACSQPATPPQRGPRSAPQQAAGARTISIVGTTESGKVVRYFWTAGSTWSVESVTDLAAA